LKLAYEVMLKLAFVQEAAKWELARLYLNLLNIRSDSSTWDKQC